MTLNFPKSTAVWLVDNTALTFQQIADFCGLDVLEIQSIADGELAAGLLGTSPIENRQVDAGEIEKGEKDPEYRLQMKHNAWLEGEKRQIGPRYTPVSKRGDKPAAILWMIKNCPDVSTGQICRLIGTTKSTVDKIRDRTHWNIANIQPTDPVTLGLCRQKALNDAISKAKKRNPAPQPDPESGLKISTVVSEPSRSDGKTPSALTELENFTLGD
ncbi:MAG: DUF1013 domain-containing protein [Rhodobacteraceae bacterium]|nr:DUF1013 domain-containing protein [Paracoccaceae bacterium]